MKFIEHFDNFLVDEVNLNKTRMDNLESKVGAIERFIESKWEVPVSKFDKQGSWAHGTIIKPPRTKGFDADLLVFVDPHKSWTAKQYIDSLYSIFSASGVYGDKVSRKTRCVTIDYAEDFSLDVVPCVLRLGGLLGQEICNRRDDVFERTDGEGFTTWWNVRCGRASGNSLREATRLIKYMRDIKLTFSVKSVLLTTMVGERVNAFDPVFNVLSDVPTTLKVVFDRLDDYLEPMEEMPQITNPAMPSETFTRHWDEDKFRNFKEKVHTYRSWIDDAYDEKDEAESLTKWRDVFGEEFGAEAVVEEARQLSAGYMTRIARSATPTALSVGRTLAVDFLRSIPARVPWARRPRWRIERSTTVLIRAGLYESKGGQRIGSLESGQVMPRGKGILFEAVNTMGLPLGEGFDVEWRVVNTDPEGLRSASQLRGGFYPSDAGNGRRWEETSYRGIHWVEAFAIRTRDKLCVGQSERFFVVIE